MKEVEDLGECAYDHIWRYSENEDEGMVRKCAYCLRRESMKGEWVKIEDGQSTQT